MNIKGGGRLQSFRISKSTNLFAIFRSQAIAFRALGMPLACGYELNQVLLKILDIFKRFLTYTCTCGLVCGRGALDASLPSEDIAGFTVQRIESM